MYILFDKETKRVIGVSNKPFVSYTSNLELAEYYGEIPNNDYLTVFNERQETKTWTEPKIVEKLDDNGEPILDENGDIVFVEVEEKKSRTYLTCDLLANFYPPKTEEQLDKEKEEKYKKLVEILIRKKYSQGKVESIHSNYLKAMFNGTDLTSAKKEEYIAEFNAFQKYREECKKEAHIDVYGGEKQ